MLVPPFGVFEGTSPSLVSSLPHLCLFIYLPLFSPLVFSSESWRLFLSLWLAIIFDFLCLCQSNRFCRMATLIFSYLSLVIISLSLPSLNIFKSFHLSSQAPHGVHTISRVIPSPLDNQSLYLISFDPIDRNWTQLF